MCAGDIMSPGFHTLSSGHSIAEAVKMFHIASAWAPS